MYIVAAHEKNGALTEFKQVYSLDRPDIEFQFSKETIIYGMKLGNRKMTAFWKIIDGKPTLVEGQEITICKDGNLRTINDDDVVNNLSSLPKF